MLLNGREEEEKDDRKEQTEGDYKLCSLNIKFRSERNLHQCVLLLAETKHKVT